MSHLSLEADGSTLHILIQQAAVQLRGCFFHTVASNWSPKTCRYLPCGVFCIGYTCSRTKRYSALSPCCLGKTISRRNLVLPQDLQWNHSTWKVRVWTHFSQFSWSNNAGEIMQYVCLHIYLYFSLPFFNRFHWHLGKRQRSQGWDPVHQRFSQPLASKKGQHGY